MNSVEASRILTRISYRNWAFAVIDSEQGMYFGSSMSGDMEQAIRYAQCGEFRVSVIFSESDFVRFVLKYVLSEEERHAKEEFRYSGFSIFGEAISVDSLVNIYGQISSESGVESEFQLGSNPVPDDPVETPLPESVAPSVDQQRAVFNENLSLPLCLGECGRVANPDDERFCSKVCQAQWLWNRGLESCGCPNGHPPCEYCVNYNPDLPARPPLEKCRAGCGNDCYSEDSLFCSKQCQKEFFLTLRQQPDGSEWPLSPELPASRPRPVPAAPEPASAGVDAVYDIIEFDQSGVDSDEE